MVITCRLTTSGLTPVSPVQPVGLLLGEGEGGGGQGEGGKGGGGKREGRGEGLRKRTGLEA